MKRLFTRSPLTLPQKLRIIFSPLAFLPVLAGVSFAQTEAFSVRGSSGESYIYVDSDGKVAIDTSTVFGTLTVNGNYGIVAFGALGGIGTLSIGAGTRMMWYPRRAAFRAGNVNGTQWDDANIGSYSVAAGYSTKASVDGAVAMGSGSIASGVTSVAMGFNTTATANSSFAMGFSTQAGGSYSVALGYRTVATGNYSFAAGDTTTASGNYGVALGHQTTASGIASTAMGSFASTNSHQGSFIYGDFTIGDTVRSDADQQFMVRATGGFKFYTGYGGSNSNPQTSWVGAQLGSNQTAWSTLSDSTMKENFLPIDAEAVLLKIKSFNLRSWNYKGQDPNAFRHYGPMAQEFFNAFGHDGYGTVGNDTTINSADFDGINLIAIQALEKRTAELKAAAAQISKLQDQTTSLKEEVKNQKQRIGMQNEKIAAMQSQLSELRQAVSVLLHSSPGEGKTVLTSRDGK